MSDLLRAVASETGSELRICVGEPPAIRMHGLSRVFEGPALQPEDTEELMRGITPEHCIQQACQHGVAEFGFTFGELARFRVTLLKEKGHFTLFLRPGPRRARGGLP